MARNKILNGVTDFFGDIIRARHASSIYSRLADLSDEGLKARGLTREQLPAYAYKRAFDA